MHTPEAIEAFFRERFTRSWAKLRTLIRQEGECYRWYGSFDKSFYAGSGSPVISYNRKNYRATRLLAVALGILDSLDDPREIHHTCLHEWCMRPDHWEALSHSEHMRKHWALRREAKTSIAA